MYIKDELDIGVVGGVARLVGRPAHGAQRQRAARRGRRAQLRAVGAQRAQLAPRRAVLAPEQLLEEAHGQHLQRLGLRVGEVQLRHGGRVPQARAPQPQRRRQPRQRAQQRRLQRVRGRRAVRGARVPQPAVGRRARQQAVRARQHLPAHR